MLNIITKSKIKQRIILLFVYNPGKEYYINEIAKLVKTSAGTTQRELEKLLANGLLIKNRRANLVYYKLDIGNRLLPDIKNIIDKTIGLDYILKKELSGLDSIEFAFLFGSYVKENFKTSSDIDLYVIGDMSEKKLYEKIKVAENKIRREINYHLATVNEFETNIKKSFFYQEILKNYLLIIGDEQKFRKFIGRTA